MWITACASYYNNYCVGRRALYKNHIFSVKSEFWVVALWLPHPELINFQIKSRHQNTKPSLRKKIFLKDKAEVSKTKKKLKINKQLHICLMQHTLTQPSLFLCPVASSASSFPPIHQSSLRWCYQSLKIDAGDSVSGQECVVGPFELSLTTVPDILPVS
jgi:hypothetical protein